MSSIIDRSRYNSRPRGSVSSEGKNGEVRKAFANSYGSRSCKIFDDKQNQLIAGPLSSGNRGNQILSSKKPDNIYTISSVISGYRDDGFVNLFDSMESAVQGKPSKSVKCFCGPVMQAHLMSADIGVKLISVHKMGLAVISDFSLNPLKKVPLSEYGKPKDSAINCDESKLATVNRDQSVTLIELRTFSLEDRWHMTSCFNPIGVDFSPKERSLFMTCCEGFPEDFNFVSLWDFRSKNQGNVHVILNQPTNCLKWSTRDTNLVAISTVDGFIQFVDIRNPGSEARSLKIDNQKTIKKMKWVGDCLVGFNETNNVIKIDEIKNKFTLIETGLPTEIIVRDIIENNSKFYAIGDDSVFPRPINFSI